MACQSQFIITFAVLKLHFIIGWLLLSASAGLFAFPSAAAIPKNGVLDLRGTVLNSSSFYNLNGEWEFYWEKLLTPESYPSEKERGSGILVTVPSYWKSYKSLGEVRSGFGYGTYAMTIILPAGFASALCFDIPVFDVAYRFYLNDMLVGKNGSVGTTREEEQPWYEPSLFCYIPDGDTLQLLIQVSNFHHRRGGFWQSVLMGGSDEILGRAERRKMFNYSTIGVLFFFTVFFFIFWFFLKRETMMLFFALTALGILMRSVNTGLFFSNSIVYTPWAWQIRMEYFGTYLAHIFGMIFLHKMFPRKYMNRVIRINTIITSLLIVGVFTLPVRIFAYEMLFFQPLILLFLTHYLVVSLIGTFRGKPMDAIFFASLGLFLYTLINDIMLANSAGSVSNNYMSQISFQVFIFAMAVMIIMQWVSNYNARVHLESSLRFKNKVLSVIAHDLKNPVASVAQFSELLATKTHLSGEQKIITSLQESSQAAVTLLDNLLYWGRSQADELTVSPSDFNIESLITEVVSLFMHMATQKEVSLRSNVYPGTTVHADRDLINIVIRNLVSNAIKFTPGKGLVTIEAQPEGDRVRISVKDTGIGIKPEILDQFQKSGKLKSSFGTDMEIGTGLGLQLVNDLVSRNGGVLKVDSTPRAGSTFTFTLPGGKTIEEE
jgi:two-component system sensor histidine kinase ChiS